LGGVLVVVLNGHSDTIKNTGNDANAVPAAKVTTHKPGLNQPVRDGKFEFMVAKVECGIPSVGDQYLGKSAQGQYCEATVTVKNISSQPKTFDGGAQKAKGTNGQTYDDDTLAEIYANSQDQTFLDEINPGNQVTGILVFDIPKDAKITQMELHDSSFSGGVTVAVA
jgi:hypothetical protein